MNVRSTAISAGFCSALVCALASAQTHPGFEKYTPSRIEWLQVTAQASFRHPATTEEPYSLVILPTDSETLTVMVRYDPILDQTPSNADRAMLLQATRNGMMMDIKVTSDTLKGIAKARGWNWLKVKEDVKNSKQAEQ